MKVRFVGSEWFSWGQHGGYGAFNRKLGKELVKRGLEVEAVVQKIMPSQQDAGGFEFIDGVKVITLPRGKIGKFRTNLYKSDADIIHSENGPLDTYLSFKQNSTTPKVLTVQDLRTKDELALIGDAEPRNFVKRCWGLIVDDFYRQSFYMANVCTCQAELLKPKIELKYGFNNCQLLPNFVDIPEESAIKKSKEPSAVFLGRLDPIKRPELYFQIAKMMPWVTFYVLGEAHDAERNYKLKQMVKDLHNLKFLGFQDGTVKADILSKAWILVNCSRYECLPVSFLEALSYKCALLAVVNPDDYTSMFGKYVPDQYKFELFTGLKPQDWGVNLGSDLIREFNYLLDNDRWRGLGEAGYKYVREKHSTEVGVNNHLKIYEELLK